MRPDAGEVLGADERQEALGLVELAEFLSLLHLRPLRYLQSSAQRVTGQP